MVLPDQKGLIFDWFECDITIYAVHTADNPFYVFIEREMGEQRRNREAANVDARAPVSLLKSMFVC